MCMCVYMCGDGWVGTFNCVSLKELKSKLYNSSTLCQVVFQVLHYANLIVAHAPTV